MKRRLTFLAAGAALALALTGCTSTSTLGGADALPAGTGSSQATAPEAVPAPSFTAALADGTEIDSADLFTGRVTLVQFMASWCTQCVGQAELLTETAADLGDDVHVVFVSSDKDDEALQQFLRDNADDVPVVMDADGQLFHRYAVVEPPVTAVLDSTGGIVRMWPGGATAEQLDDELDALLK
ncbi:TlpA family protein disulfide reductase [Microbacterium sp. NPDC055910]|uniref:TlpA family protein disulfide reductase n=1 Tax=Microbacterium sp. NPDC055910 TaxID=3345659 RepID=UPI0035DC3365